MIDTPDPIQFWAIVAPDRPAVRQGDRAWTYRELNAAVQEAADAFLEQGLGDGEHISLEFEPGHSIAFTIAFHALHRIGLLPVPIGHSLTLDERQTLHSKALVDLALTSADLESPGKHAKSSADSARPLSELGPLFARRLNMPAALCFTSGTSGVPRAALLTHGNFFWSALASGRNLGVRPHDLWLCCLPLHHVGGLSILTRSAYYGSGVLFHNRFDPDAVNEAIDAQGVTLISLVPTMLERLLRARNGRLYPTHLRAALIGGGPMPAELLEEAAELRLHALPTYGFTEATSQVTTLSLREWPAGLSSAGRPLMFVRMEIHDADGNPVGRGIEGEIVVRGPMVFAAYFEGKGANAAAWAGRWFKTGDIGEWDSAGRLVVLDRRADRIIVGGENVSPSEVERTLRQHSAVADACVVGIPSRSWGHEIAAAVELRPGTSVTLEELRHHAAATLSPFKLPRRLLIAPELPRNASGKLLRRAARDLFESEVPVVKPA